MTIVDLLNGRLHGDWRSFLNRFRVSDLHAADQTVRAWLVCESPHTREIESGHPLAGPAGKTVSKALVKCGLIDSQYKNCPIGNIINDNDVDWMGIINVCELPLQCSAYFKRVGSCDSFHQFDDELSLTE